MLVAPAPTAVISQENVQAGLPKNMVPDPGWFDGERTKFEDWWRGIRLFLKSNSVIETDDRITVILAHLRRGVAGIYAQRKLDELDEELETQDFTSVGQGYKSTEGRHDYKTSTGMTYGGRGQPIDIRKSNDNFKDGKPKCFNYNKYGHMAKEC